MCPKEHLQHSCPGATVPHPGRRSIMLCPGLCFTGRSALCASLSAGHLAGERGLPQGKSRCETWPEGTVAAEPPPPPDSRELATLSLARRGLGAAERRAVAKAAVRGLFQTPSTGRCRTGQSRTPSASRRSAAAVKGEGGAEGATLDQGLQEHPVLSPSHCCTPPSLSKRHRRGKGDPHPAFATFPSKSACPGTALQFCPAEWPPPWLKGIPWWATNLPTIWEARAVKPQLSPKARQKHGSPKAHPQRMPTGGSTPRPPPHLVWHPKQAPC